MSLVPELLNPAGLLWLSLVPLLFVPYLLRQRPRRRTVPALFLFNGVEPAQRLRLGGSLRLRPLFLLQLFLLIVAIAALCRPALRSNDVRSALVLDNSASLSAIEGSGETRFAAAVRAADRGGRARPGRQLGSVRAVADAARARAGPFAGVRREVASPSSRPASCAHPDETVLALFLRPALAPRATPGSTSSPIAARTSMRPLRVDPHRSPTSNRAITDLSCRSRSSVADRSRFAERRRRELLAASRKRADPGRGRRRGGR